MDSACRSSCQPVHRPVRGNAAFALLVVAFSLAGCYQSSFPLDVKPATAVDPKYLGAWHCVSGSSDDAVTVTIGRAREGVYDVSLKEKGEDPDRYEIHASKVGGQEFLNLRDMGTKSSQPWSYGRSVLLRPDVLQLEMVDDAAMKGVAATPAAVRAAIEKKLNDPALFSKGPIVCVRATRDQ